MNNEIDEYTLISHDGDVVLTNASKEAIKNFKTNDPSEYSVYDYDGNEITELDDFIANY